MAEYIKREAITQEILGLTIVDSAVAAYADAVLDCTQRIPAADVAPVVYGQWITIEKWAAKAQYKCSVCGRRIMASLDVAKVMGKYPYCNCGANMEEVR